MPYRVYKSRYRWKLNRDCMTGLGCASRLIALALLLSMAQGAASAGWAFVEAGHRPLSPDHEDVVTFTVRLVLVNDTSGGAGNESGGGSEGDGNETGPGGGGDGATTNVTVSSARLLIGNESALRAVNMTLLSSDNISAEFSTSLGPLSPGEELFYRFEATLSNESVVLSNGSWVRAPELASVKWHRNTTRAMELARALGRPVLLLIYDEMDPSLRELEEGPLREPAVLELSARFVCARASISEDPGLAGLYGLGSLPGLVFINASTGETLGKITGVPPGAELAAEMRRVLGPGPKAQIPMEGGLDYRILFLALSLTLVVGTGALWTRLRRERGA